MPIEVPPHSDNLTAIKSDGTTVSPGVGAGCSLANSTTYVFSLGGDRLIGAAPLSSAQVQWDSAFVGTITVETCNWAQKIGRPDNTGATDVSEFDVTTKGAWMQENPSTAYISVTSTDGTTGGATVTNATIAVAGGTAGGASIQLGNLGARRCRLKVVVTTGGVVRGGMYAKAVG